MSKSNKKKVLLAASIAGLMAVAGVPASTGIAYAEVNCAGANACKGMGDCGGKGHSCAGQNACKGQGWVKLPSAEDPARVLEAIARDPRERNRSTVFRPSDEVYAT